VKQLLPALMLSLATAPALANGALGYYRFPALHRDTLVFVAEGDLWRVPITGGLAQRLTAHPGDESRPAISPDGQTLAFSATYEGPTEVYTMPLEGGPPVRRTFEGAAALVVGWSADAKLLYSTRRHATLPNTQLAELDLESREATLVPLSQASDGSVDPASGTLFFTRLPFQGSHTKRYKGGTAQQLWRFAKGDPEAKPLTADYAGTSKTPMFWSGRVYFASDRDGTMNLWSMRPDGSDLRRHTSHDGFDVQSPSLSGGRIAYQLGADIRVYDIAADADRSVSIRLSSDFDHLRERWVKNPLELVTALHPSPTGDRVVFTARGQVFVLPSLQGRIVEAVRGKNVRYRDAKFLPDGKNLLALSDQTGEVELARLPSNGVGQPEVLTNDGKILRWEAVPSPDGKWVAHHNKDQELWLLRADTKESKRIAVSEHDDFSFLSWSPDSRFLAFVEAAANTFHQVKVYDLESGRIAALTSDRYDSFSPAWSTDGKWLYLLSDRTLQSVVRSPWGARQPEPFFDKQTRIYHVALKKGLRSPFQAADELMPAKAEPAQKDQETKDAAKSHAAKTTDAKATAKAGDKPDPGKTEAATRVEIDWEGIQQRLLEVAPVPAGNYERLSLDGKRLYFVSRDASVEPKRALRTLEIDNKPSLQVETFMEDVRYYELSADRKKVLVRKADDVYVFDAGAKAPAAAELSKSGVNLKAWSFAFDPREEWRQMYAEAWRLERDYFYDKGMHGLDWSAIRAKYAPLVERVTDRAELSDVLAQMVGELSALHIFVRGGDLRRGQDQVEPASLGAVIVSDSGGCRVQHVYRSDPDRPERRSPLARPGVDVSDGDVIESVNGVATRTVAQLNALLRNQADKQVLLRVKPRAGGTARDVVVTPISQQKENDLRYDEWEYDRRLRVERLGQGRIGYVHLRAMGPDNMAEWTREFYPVFDRDGLIVDVRHNNGGNIDSWVLEKLLRKAWFYWQPRVGRPFWNMQYAFRGHVVVLMNERTASDGEAFAEGFRRLGLGKLIGTRTWGGEIWLSSSNVLVDRGIATAAEIGVFGPEGEWLIEGHGVEPDIVVDNLPHATFRGEDAQLQKAVEYLQEQIRLKPIPVPVAPKHPDKSGRKERAVTN
jgi:tricorn protease